MAQRAQKGQNDEERALSVLGEMETALGARVKALQNEVESVTTRVTQQKLESQQVEQELEKHKAALSELGDRLRTTEERLREAMAEEAGARARAQATQEDAELARAEAAKARAVSQAAWEDAASAKAEAAEARAETKAARSALALAKEELDTYKAEAAAQKQEVSNAKTELHALRSQISEAKANLTTERVKIAHLNQERENLQAAIKDTRLWHQLEMSEWMAADEPPAGKVPKLMLVALEIVRARPDYTAHLAGFSRDDIVARGLWLLLTNMGADLTIIKLAVLACEVEERNRNRRIPAAAQTQFVRVKGGRGRPSSNEQIVASALKEIDDAWRRMKSQRPPLLAAGNTAPTGDTDDDPEE